MYAGICVLEHNMHAGSNSCLAHAGFIDGVYFSTNLNKVPNGAPTMRAATLHVCGHSHPFKNRRKSHAEADGCRQGHGVRCARRAGGWFAVAIAFAVFTVSELWQFGTKRKQSAINSNKVRIRRGCAGAASV